MGRFSVPQATKKVNRALMVKFLRKKSSVSLKKVQENATEEQGLDDGWDSDLLALDTGRKRRRRRRRRRLLYPFSKTMFC